MEPSQSSVPQHIGIILDGNRRYAKKLMLKPWKGHEWGAKKVEEILTWCKELGIHELTLYSFSLENFDRPQEEFEYLMGIFRDNFSKLLADKERLSSEGLRITFIGRITLFPKDIQEIMHSLMELTKENTKHVINFAMAYSGRAEVVDATKAIAELVATGKKTVEDINEELFREHLYLPRDPDLIIRTGGDIRTSNFLNYQSAYSEYFFIEKSLPDFTKEDFMTILETFSQRERRYGC